MKTKISAKHKIKEIQVNNKVSIGSTTKVGWGASFLALLPTIIKATEEGKIAFNGPEKYLAIGGIVIGAITQIGRYLQAHKLIGNIPNYEEFESPIAAPTSAEESVK